MLIVPHTGIISRREQGLSVRPAGFTQTLHAYLFKGQTAEKTDVIGLGAVCFPTFFFVAVQHLKRLFHSRVSYLPEVRLEAFAMEKFADICVGLSFSFGSPGRVQSGSAYFAVSSH